jgi:hypothetical protein
MGQENIIIFVHICLHKHKETPEVYLGNWSTSGGVRVEPESSASKDFEAHEYNSPPLPTISLSKVSSVHGQP